MMRCLPPDVFQRGRGRRRGGIAALEGVIVIVAFLVVMFTMLDLSLLVLDYNLLCDGADRFCRQAMVHGAKAPPLSTAWGPETARGNASDGSPYSEAFKGDLVTLSLADVTYSLEWPSGTNQPGDPVKAILSYRYAPMMPFVFGKKAITLQAAATMRVEH